MNRKLLISFLAMVIMIIVMRMQGSMLITTASPKGILDLEFAKTAERLNYLRLFLDHGAVVQNIFLDFLFIAAYTWFFVTACLFVKERNAWSKWSDHFKGIAIAAALFDVCENFLMLLVWNERFGPGLLQIVYYCAAIKFILAGMVVMYLLISIPFIFRRKKF
ncbi:MAG: hypothetical protein ACJ749_12850 [Flavisolibacter sp.]